MKVSDSRGSGVSRVICVWGVGDASEGETGQAGQAGGSGGSGGDGQTQVVLDLEGGGDDDVDMEDLGLQGSLADPGDFEEAF